MKDCQHGHRIRGMMTFREIAAYADMPPEDFIKRLGLPESVTPGDKAGRACRMHGLTMMHVRRLAGEEDEGTCEHPEKLK